MADTKGKILIIEDDAEIVRMLSMYLERQGYEVHTSKTVDGGWELLSALKFGLILLDNFLPKVDGLSVLPDLVDRSGADVIMMTGAPDERGRQDALDLGARAYLTKPVKLDDLDREVAAVFAT